MSEANSGIENFNSISLRASLAIVPVPVEIGEAGAIG